MKTSVVNLKYSKYDVYIGRKGHGKDGYFGNPIIIGRRCICGMFHCHPGGTIDCFTEYFYKRLAHDPLFKERVEQLRGKRLGCFCKPDPCHGDVIVEYLEDPEEREWLWRKYNERTQ